MRSWAVAFCWVLAVLPATAADSITGRVFDASGAALPGVVVRVLGPAVRDATTGADGGFAIGGLTPGRYDVVAAVDGFAEWRQRVTIEKAAPATPLRITLVPRGVTDTLVVTASRGAARERDAAAPVSVVSASSLALAPSPVLDDALRTTPGFSLFRRTSSRTANPTTQGATLRGLAASGASRALVLADGVPLNDPFGGWVYWNRVPQAAVDRVEVVRGAASDLYGADALGGVIQVLTAAPASARAARVVIDGDTAATARTSVFGAGRRGVWSGDAAGEASRTDGAFVLDAATRGLVDRKAGSDYLSGRVSGGVEAQGWRARGRVAGYGESRRNGTALQVNDTSQRQAGVDAAGPVARGFLDATVTAGDQTYHQTFSAVSPSRESETLTSRQTVPATVVSAGVTYRVAIGSADLLAGADGREVRGTNQDVAYFPGGAVRSITSSPGYDRTIGGFGQLRATFGDRATLTAGIRGDRWQREPHADAVLVTSPRVTGSFRLAPHLTVRGSVGRAFRAPTPNERVRPFRVGNTLTLANPDLLPERLTMGEAGLAVDGARASVRAAAFAGTVHDAVTNVTLSATPVLVTRRRENAAAVRVRGLELEGDWRLRDRLWLDGEVALTRSTYRDTPGLSGNDVPQVPRWQATVGLRWLAPGAVTLQGLVRGLGRQYEDDRNTLALRQATLVDLSGSRPVGRRVSLLGAVENLFDVDYDTGRTPTRTIGTPITARVAVRLTY